MIKIMEKYKKIEEEINKENFRNIQEDDRNNIYKFFENKESDENKFIKEIFNKDIINNFIKFKEENKVKENLMDFSISSISKTLTISKRFKKRKMKKKKRTPKFKDMKLSEILARIELDSKNNASEENSEKAYDSKEKLIISNIFENQIKILILVENANIIINSICISNSEKNSPIIISEEEFYKCKEYYSKNKESGKYKIFEYFEEIKKGLISEYYNNSKLVLELTIEKTNNDYSCQYELFSQNIVVNKTNISFKEEQITLKKPNIYKLFLLLKENEKKYPSKCDDKNDIQKEKNIKISPPLNSKQFNDINDTLIYMSTIAFSKRPYISQANNYQILLFIGVIGNHNERQKNDTAEFIKELKNCNCFISGGTDNTLKIYSPDFEEETTEYLGINEWIYSTCESDEKSFIACANEELYLYLLKEEEDDFPFKFYKLTDITCISAIEMYIQEKEIKKIKLNNDNDKIKGEFESEEYEEKIVKHTVIIGRNGLIDIKNAFYTNDLYIGKSNFPPYNILIDGIYRNIIKLNEHNLAITSNSVFPGGENILIIFNLFKKEIKEKIEGYSFIASTNGMSVISEKFLLCACKRYLEGQKNGILFVILNYEENSNSKAIFFDTGDFEVYCFCPVTNKHDIFDFGSFNSN